MNKHAPHFKCVCITNQMVLPNYRFDNAQHTRTILPINGYSSLDRTVTKSIGNVP